MPTEVNAHIEHYHVHIYYNTDIARASAVWVREHLAKQFPAARLGRWHDIPVGPHPQGMFQVAFDAALLPALLPWLMLNRQGLDVLLHPETGRQRADHSDHAAWLGQLLPLDLDRLPPD